MSHFDAIVIGAGQSGGPLATALGKTGYRTAIIERAHVGGSCINWGCTPTKTMIASARVAHVTRRAADYGVHTGPVAVDLAQVRERKRQMVESFRSGTRRSIENSAGVELIEGEARFGDPHTLLVSTTTGKGPLSGERRLTGERIFVNTGTRPAVPPIPGLRQVPFLDSTSIMELESIPEHLLVMGGGYVGLEFAQMFRRFGSQVTIVQRGAQLLSREDPDIAAEIAQILRDEGIRVLLKSEARRVEAGKSEQVCLTVRSPEGEETLTGSHLLVATGQQPNTDVLNPAAAGLETDSKGYIRVNERLETNQPHIFAMGDVNGGPAFTHVSYDDFRILRANLLEGGQRTTSDRLTVYTVFTDPQLGRVGLSEQEAHEQGRNIKVARMPMSRVARASEVDETRGLMKAVVDADSGQILGCAILGIEGGELMSMIEIAMLGKLPYTILKDAVFAHPTLAESLNNLFSQVE